MPVFGLGVLCVNRLEVIGGNRNKKATFEKCFISTNLAFFISSCSRVLERLGQRRTEIPSGMPGVHGVNVLVLVGEELLTP